MAKKRPEQAALLEGSINTLKAEFEHRRTRSQRGNRPLPASVVRAYQLAIEQRTAELAGLKTDDRETDL
jgi:hypothetical protein